MADGSQQRSKEDLDRELIELLNELRVALPGVQVLFAFLLAVPFANGWTRVTDLQRDVFFVAFLAAATSTILLIAPSAHHRLRWREGDKERILQRANDLAIAGTVFLVTEDCQASYEELSARGVEFTEKPEDRPYGIDSGFRDPSGNSIRLTQLKPL